MASVATVDDYIRSFTERNGYPPSRDTIRGILRMTRRAESFDNAMRRSLRDIDNRRILRGA